MKNKNRIEMAETYHKKRFNCAQSVVMAFADLYGIDEKIMARISCAFGGGIGSQRLTCGAVLGMCMLIGLEEGNEDSNDTEKKKSCYEQTQILCSKFSKEYGSMECKDIIGVVPCNEKVKLAAKIFNEYLIGKGKDCDMASK